MSCRNIQIGAVLAVSIELFLVSGCREDAIATADTLPAGTPEAMFEKANEYLATGDYGSYAKWLRKSAENGSIGAQGLLVLYHKEGMLGIKKDKDEEVKWLRRMAESGDEYAKERLEAIKKENERDENAFGVAGVKLGMTAAQVENRLGKFNLIDQEAAAIKMMTGGLFESGQVDREYHAVNPRTGAGNSLMNVLPRIDKKTGKWTGGPPIYEKEGFKFWELVFTRKELGPRVFSMRVSREFDAMPDWDALRNKLVEKYGKPTIVSVGNTKSMSGYVSAKVIRQYLWGDCVSVEPLVCKESALLVSFEKGKAGWTNEDKVGLIMKFMDSKLSDDNDIAIEKATQEKKQAKETKTARQVDRLKF